MKIIKKDNFDRDSVSDVLIAENVPQYWAELIERVLNETLGGPTRDVWIVATPDDYKLYVYNPE